MKWNIDVLYYKKMENPSYIYDYSKYEDLCLDGFSYFLIGLCFSYSRMLSFNSTFATLGLNAILEYAKVGNAFISR